MRKLFVLALLTFIGFSGFSQDKKYEINLKISDMESGEDVEIYKFNDDDKPLSSVKSNGTTAQLKFSHKDYCFGVIKLPSKSLSSYVFLEPGVYNINCTLKELEDASFHPQVIGSKSNDELIFYLENVIPEYDSYSDAKGDKKTTISKKIVSDIISIVKKNPGSYCSAMIISELKKIFEENPEELSKVYNMFNSKVKDSEYGKEIDKIIQKDKMLSIGKVFPSFQMQDVNDKTFNLSELKGKYVLLDFWASWCKPCRDENPNVKEAFETYKDKNFTVVGISLDEDKTEWKDAIENDELSWYHVSDLAGWDNKLAKQYMVNSIPFNVLLDPSGKIIAKNLRGVALFKTLRLKLKK